MKYKVIVADDEDVIRKGIVYLIDWDKLNCEIVQECTDGLQVLKYLEKNTADIVICLLYTSFLRQPGRLPLLSAATRACRKMTT